jgi:hypothetical protein
MKKEFVTYDLALRMKQLGFDEPCLKAYDKNGILYHSHKTDKLFTVLNSNLSTQCSAPLFQQAINFLYICSNKKIDIELKASDTYEKRVRKIKQGCEDLWNLQNNKSK